MASEMKAHATEAESPARRRLNRDAAEKPLVDKARVLAHLQAQLAQLEQSEEVTHAGA